MSKNAALVNLKTREVYWIPGGIVEVGRSTDHPVAIMDPALSRTHARIYNVAEGFWVEDLGSTNGTFIRGSELSEPTLIEPGEKVQFGDLLFLYEEREAFKMNTAPSHDPKEEVEEVSRSSSRGETAAHTMPTRECVNMHRRKTARVDVTGIIKKHPQPAGGKYTAPLPSKYGVTDSGRITPVERIQRRAVQGVNTQVKALPAQAFPWKTVLVVSVLVSLVLGVLLGFIIKTNS